MLRNVTVQTVFELFSCNNSETRLLYRMGYIVIFNRLAGIPNAALLVPPMVHPLRKFCEFLCLCGIDLLLNSAVHIYN